METKKMNKYNHDNYKIFAQKANDKDYVLMNSLLEAVKDYFLGKSKLNINLSVWESTPEAENLIDMGICLADSPLKACVKTIEYLSDKYEVAIFEGDSDNDDDVKLFCQESVSIPFEERRK